MKIFSIAITFTLALASTDLRASETNAPTTTQATNVFSRLLRPLSMAEALDIALQQNSAILKSQAELEANYGLVVQTRAIVLPKLAVGSSYSANSSEFTDRFQTNDKGLTNDFINNAFDFSNQRWSADIRVTQSIYEGGKMTSALRAARLLRERALLDHQTVIADIVRDVRVVYYDVLLAQQQIIVQEASLKLLQQQLEETTRRFEAGTVPRFNVLRAEVEVANARPKLIRARNAFRVAKDNLATVLGETIPAGTDELALQLTDKLQAAPFPVQLSPAIAVALANRTELAALRKVESLRNEGIVSAKSGYKPSVQIFGGYAARSSQFNRNLTFELDGWEAGAQLSWNLFDGFLTRGRVQEAEGLRKKATEEIADAERHVELDVRTAYSSFIEAKEVLLSQEKVQESAEESLRQANARFVAGTTTQLDVLNAQTSLTEARSTEVLALRDYAVAVARLERAIGQTITPATTNAPAVVAPPPAK